MHFINRPFPRAIAACATVSDRTSFVCVTAVGCETIDAAASDGCCSRLGLFVKYTSFLFHGFFGLTDYW